MRAFVTGGTGFLGRPLAAALLAKGWEVTVLTREPTRARDLESRGATLVEGDVSRPGFSSGLRGADVVFHLAAWFEFGVRDFRRMFEINVTGTANVLALAKDGGVPRVVYTGAAGVLAPEPPGHPITEASGVKGVLTDPYAVTKRQAMELVLNEMQTGAPITVVGPAAVFGPGDAGQFGRTLAMLVRGRLSMVPRGFGANTWVHVDDVAQGHLLAATVGKPGRMYLLGDRVLSTMDFYHAAATAAGVRPPSRTVPMALARMAARGSELRARLRGTTPFLSRGLLQVGSLDLVVDATRARTEIGWTPGPFEARLRETMAWYVRTYRGTDAPLPIKPGGASAEGPPRRA